MGWNHSSVSSLFSPLRCKFKAARGGFGTQPAAHVSPVQPEEVIVNKTLGIVLIALGLLGLVWGGFSYKTSEKVVDIGPIHATREKTHNVPLPPIAGAVALVAG